jgi:fatty-acyl-CoA synthase
MLARLLQARARIHDSLAVVDLKRGGYTYSQLESLSQDLARRLTKTVGRGDRVCVLAPNSAHYLAMFFALRKLGATLVPLNPSLEKTSIDLILERTRPKLVVDESGVRGTSIDELLEEPGVEFRESESDPAMILYTGGTTGDPKGALIPERQIVWNAVNTIVSWGLGANDSTYNTMPMYHTGGWNVLTIPLLLAGGKVLIDPERFDAGRTIDVLCDQGCTIYMGVPTMLDAISRHPSFDRDDLKRVLFVSGGGILPAPVFERFRRRGLRLFQGYGLTEAGPNNFYVPPERFAIKPWCVGRPMVFVDAKLGVDGELLLRGPHVFDGYLEGSENPFDEEGYLHTGDVFTVDGDGDYVFLDRLKDVVKTGGENVYTSEVERAILENPLVKEAAVVGVPDEHWGEKVVAFIVAAGPLDVETLRAHLKARLAGFKVPKEFHVVDSLPRSPYGKVLKSQLKRMLG